MNVNTVILRKFNTMFKKNEKGENREWRDIEGGEKTILEIFTKCKENIVEIINAFKDIELPKRITKEPNTPNSMLDDIAAIEGDKDFFE